MSTAGTVTATSLGGTTTTRAFDLVVGGDGAGSVVRKAMQAQVEGITVESKSLPNYCTMIELDRVGDRLDRHYLYGLSVRPFCGRRRDQGRQRTRFLALVLCRRHAHEAGVRLRG